MENFLKVINDLISEEKCSAKDLFPSPQIFLTAFEFFFIQELLPGTTNDGNRLRQQLKEEEEEKERQKVATENKRRTKGQNKALAAFMKTTVRKNQWERSVRIDSNCPFCGKHFPSNILENHVSCCPADREAT